MNRLFSSLFGKTHVYNLPAPVDKSKTAKEEARELQLKEEASVREKVGHVQENLALMLDALGELAIANPVFTHGQLPHLVSNPICIVQLFISVTIHTPCFYCASSQYQTWLIKSPKQYLL